MQPCGGAAIAAWLVSAAWGADLMTGANGEVARVDDKRG
jgi:hypothetical protein